MAARFSVVLAAARRFLRIIISTSRESTASSYVGGGFDCHLWRYRAYSGMRDIGHITVGCSRVGSDEITNSVPFDGLCVLVGGP